MSPRSRRCSACPASVLSAVMHIQKHAPSPLEHPQAQASSITQTQPCITRPPNTAVAPQEPCSCPSQQLGGVSAGGWVALSLFIGMFVGSTLTVLFQCWRRRRELRYMSKVGHSRARPRPVHETVASVASTCGTDNDARRVLHQQLNSMLYVTHTSNTHDPPSCHYNS